MVFTAKKLIITNIHFHLFIREFKGSISKFLYTSHFKHANSSCRKSQYSMEFSLKLPGMS